LRPVGDIDKSIGCISCMRHCERKHAWGPAVRFPSKMANLTLTQRFMTS